MYSYHILLLPAAVVAIVIGHILLVRKHGVVPPFTVPTSTSQAGRDGAGPGAAESAS